MDNSIFKKNAINHKKRRDFERRHRLKVIKLRNKFLAEWAANILGFREAQVKNYIVDITKLDRNLDNKIILKKIEKDFRKSKVQMSYKEIEFKSNDFQLKANVIEENKLKLNKPF